MGTELVSDVSQMELASDVSQMELANDASQTELVSEGERDASDGEMDGSEDMEQPALNEDDGIGNVDEATIATGESNTTIVEVLTDAPETTDELDVEQCEDEATK